MLKKYYVTIKKMQTINHEIEAESFEELKKVLQNYINNFNKFNNNLEEKYKTQIVDDESNIIEIVFNKDNN